MFLFAFATLTPALLIGVASLVGGVWPWVALLFVTALVAGLDILTQRARPPLSTAEFPAAAALSAGLGVVHFALLIVVILAMTGGALSVPAKLALFIAAGLYMGQVSNANAHELLHRRRRGLHNLGVWIYISLLFGHHASAHLHVHHRLAATHADPNTARFGESYYHFVRRAWLGSFQAGRAAETARLQKANRSLLRHPYLLYVVGAAIMLLLAYRLGGGTGVLCYVALACFAQQQLLLCDFVQHYGLTRQTGPDGNRAAFGPMHSWNSPHWFSSAFMLNAPRHSDHHAHPNRTFAELDLPPGSPTLPHSLPVMACIALLPGLWRQVMDPRAAAWQKTV